MLLQKAKCAYKSHIINHPFSHPSEIALYYLLTVSILLFLVRILPRPQTAIVNAVAVFFICKETHVGAAVQARLVSIEAEETHGGVVVQARLVPIEAEETHGGASVHKNSILLYASNNFCLKL